MIYQFTIHQLSHPFLFLCVSLFLSEFVCFSVFVSVFLLVSHLTIKTEKFTNMHWEYLGNWESLLWLCTSTPLLCPHNTYLLSTYFMSGPGSVLGIVNSAKMQRCSLCRLDTGLLHKSLLQCEMWYGKYLCSTGSFQRRNLFYLERKEWGRLHRRDCISIGSWQLTRSFSGVEGIPDWKNYMGKDRWAWRYWKWYWFGMDVVGCGCNVEYVVAMDYFMECFPLSPKMVMSISEGATYGGRKVLCSKMFGKFWGIYPTLSKTRNSLTY